MHSPSRTCWGAACTGVRLGVAADAGVATMSPALANAKAGWAPNAPASDGVAIMLASPSPTVEGVGTESSPIISVTAGVATWLMALCVLKPAGVATPAVGVAARGEAGCICWSLGVGARGCGAGSGVPETVA